jgi:hypothetical protein
MKVVAVSLALCLISLPAAAQVNDLPGEETLPADQEESVVLEPLVVTANPDDYGSDFDDPARGAIALALQGMNMGIASMSMFASQSPDVDQVGKQACAGPDTSDQPIGNPVVPRTGAKVHSEIDFTLDGEMPLGLARTYTQASLYAGAFGTGWASSFDYRLGFKRTDLECTYEPGVTLPWTCNNPNAPIVSVWLYRPDGARYTYRWNTTKLRWDSSKPEAIACAANHLMRA